VVVGRIIVHGPGERDWVMIAVRIGIIVVVDQVAIEVGSASFLADEYSNPCQ
jgi:hypothetical protein